jgi:Xaa-Pro aminopeptidase
LYLCGFNEPNSILVLSKDNYGKAKWLLFCQGNTEHSLTWSGPNADPQEVPQLFSVDAAYTFSKFEDYLESQKSSSFFVDYDENACYSFRQEGDIFRSANKNLIGSVLDEMRLHKSLAEIKTMRQAANIAVDAFKETLRFAKSSGGAESKLAAKVEFECKARGASGLAYVPVIAGGDRANIIHYVRNDRLVE